jgi:hypothetical protein
MRNPASAGWAHVSFAGYTALSLPSPCGRRYRLGILWSDLTPQGPSGVLLLGWYTLPSTRETAGPPRFLTSLFLRATLSDPDRPSGISPQRSLCIGFRLANTVAACCHGVTRWILLTSSLSFMSCIWGPGLLVRMFASNLFFDL